MRTFGNYRCVLCNKVSHAEISSELGEFSSGSFRHEDGDFYCSECEEWQDEIMSEWNMEDEIEEEEGR